MSLVHIHLILNHLAILGVPFVLVFLVHSVWRGNIASQKFALLAMVVISLSVLPVYFTGEPAEDKVENLPGVEKSLIHNHEEAGEVSMVLTLITGAAALGTLVLMQKNKNPGKALWIVIGLAVISAGSLAYTGNLGGVIRHTEIRGETSAASPALGGSSTSSGKQEDRD